MESRMYEDSAIGIAGRMIRTFTAPGQTFASVRDQSTWRDWLTPTLVVVVAGLVTGILALPATMEAGSEMMQEHYEEMTEAERAMAEQMQEAASAMALVAVPVVSFLWIFIVGGVVLLVANPILGGEANYGQMLAVTAYASLVKVVQAIVTLPFLLKTGTLLVIGPGLFLSEETLATFAGRVLSGLDLFTFWQVLLMAVGTGVMAGRPTRDALVPLLILWAVVLVVQAGLGGLSDAMQP